MERAIQLITEERQRQIDLEGYTPEHDLIHTEGQLAIAACCYAFPPTMTYPVYGVRSEGWPFEPEAFKETRDDRIREVTKAAAMLVAELERLLTVQETEAQSNQVEETE